jgi:hypothetical protein
MIGMPYILFAFHVFIHDIFRGREYADAHEKMSLLGVDQTTLTDCTEILPLSIDLKDLAVSSSDSDSGKQPTDPVIDPVKLEAAIQKYRSIWL